MVNHPHRPAATPRIVLLHRTGSKRIGTDNRFRTTKRMENAYGHVGT